MKTLEQILKQKPVFLNNWKCKEEVLEDFEVKDNPEVNILFGSYGYENYEGDAFVLVEKDNKLYEIHGSHCSCFGLENQFEFEESNLEVLEHKMLNGTLGDDDWSGNVFKKELCEFLGIEIEKIEKRG